MIFDPTLVWRERAMTRREAIFGPNDPLMPVSEVEDARTAVPGVIGSCYQPGGTVFLSINPAGGKDDRLSSSSDRAMYQCFRDVAEADEARLKAAFDAMNQSVLRQMPGWTIYRQHTSKLLEALRLNLQEVAYLYVVPFRTRGDSGGAIPRAIVERAYEGLKNQLRVLMPGLIICMDRHAETQAQKYASIHGEARYVYYTRKRDAHDARRAVLEKLRLSSD